MEQTTETTDWWWIDYLENELEASMDQSLAQLLESSAEDRDMFENFRLLKVWVKGSDPIDAKLEVDLQSRLDLVRKSVMAEISVLEICTRPQTQVEHVAEL